MKKLKKNFVYLGQAKGTWDQYNIYLMDVQSNYTMSSIIDSDDKLWFGSYTGISIYDGQEIKNLHNMMDYLKSHITII